MGKYFTNETLDWLWSRLVNKTKELIGSVESGWYVTTDRPGSNYLSGDYFYFDGSAIGYDYSMEDQGTWSSPIYLPSLDTRTNIGIDYNGQINTRLQYKTGGSLSNTGIKGIHDALLSYTGLERDTDPTKLADYMKGIATCARYIANGYTDYTSENTLEQIVEMIAPSYSCTLSQEGVLTLHQSASEYGYTLYENGIEIASNGADSKSSWDLSSYMTPGNEYYATGEWADYIYIGENLDMEYHYANSNSIVY